jgi:gliding motility-associated-like protein
VKANLLASLALCISVLAALPAFSQKPEDSLPSDANIDIWHTITPNGDGVNDCLAFMNASSSPICLEVFNRFGKVLVEDGNYQNDWPSKDVTAVQLPEGVYYYRIALLKPDGFDVQEYAGSFNVLR